VITPTAEEANTYHAAIATSDDQLRGIERTRGRIRLLHEFIGSAQVASANSVPEKRTTLSFERLRQVMTVDLEALEQRESDLAAALQAALQERANLRSELENRLLRDRVAPLQALGKKPGEGEPRAEGAGVL
jgi:hypothetical protein